MSDNVGSDSSSNQIDHEAIDPAAICQIEIPVSDVDVALRFYEHVFGWRRSPAEIQEYVVLETPVQRSDAQKTPSIPIPLGVSLIPNQTFPPRNGHPHAVVYFKVENPAEIARLAVTWGGTKRFGPRKIPSYGEIWRITDPDGNQFGLFKPMVKKQGGDFGLSS